MYGVIVGAALFATFGAFVMHKWFLPAIALLILALLCSPL